MTEPCKPRFQQLRDCSRLCIPITAMEGPHAAQSWYMNVHRLSHFWPGGGSPGRLRGRLRGEAENRRVHHEIGPEVGPEIGQGVFLEIGLCKPVSLHCITR